MTALGAEDISEAMDRQSKGTCFVVAPIGEPGSDIRKHSDQVLKHVIKPAVISHGYSAIRADEISEPGLITAQIIQHVVDDPLVVADLTGNNPNVFYELAIRHALRKPLIQLIAAGEPIPFDVAPMRTVHVDVHDLDSVEEAKFEIAKQIEALEIDPGSIDTPISVSLDLQSLRQSDNPEERSLADLIAALSELRAVVLSIEGRVSSPESLIPPGYLEQAFGRYYVQRPRSWPRVFRQELREIIEELPEIGEQPLDPPLVNMVRHRLERLADAVDSRGPA